jgi:hypothetical protein
MEIIQVMLLLMLELFKVNVKMCEDLSDWKLYVFCNGYF